LHSRLLSTDAAEPPQIRMSDPTQYQSIVDAEWNIIYDKLQKCADSGAKVVLSRLAIGDLGTQFFADRDIFCAGRVSHFVSEGNSHGQGNFRRAVYGGRSIV